MIFLCLAILSSALVSIFMRLSENHIKNNASMLAVNYVMCTFMAALYAGPADLFPRQAGLGTTLLLGVISGVFYLGGFLLLQWNVSKNGVVLSATFMKLGVLVPTLMSILIFHESPSPAQVLGLAGAFAAILLINFQRGAGKAANGAGLIVLLVIGGMTDAMSKIYEQVGRPELESHFLFYIFLSALILCAGLIVFRKQRVGSTEVFFGLLVGVPNYFSSRFLLLSLSNVPAVVAFPTYSVATIVLVTLVGRLCFRETLDRRRQSALLVILLSLVLLNL